jgi:protein SCO1
MNATSKPCLRLIIVFAVLLVVSSMSIKAEPSAQQSYSRSFHNYKIPNINVITQNGNKTKLSKVLSNDKSVIVNFIFTTCNAICPIMTAIMSKVHATIGASSPNLHFVSISIDPENDSPVVLAEYAKKFKAGSNWQFLTGKLSELHLIQRAFDVYRGDKMNHTSLTLMRDANTSAWVRIEGTANANEIISEYNSLNTEAKPIAVPAKTP